MNRDLDCLRDGLNILAPYGVQEVNPVDRVIYAGPEDGTVTAEDGERLARLGWTYDPDIERWFWV